MIKMGVSQGEVPKDLAVYTKALTQVTAGNTGGVVIFYTYPQNLREVNS